MKKCLSQQEEEMVVKLYKSGLSSIKISKHYGVSKATILKILRDKGIPRRSNRAFSDDIELEIVGLYEGGLSVLELGQIYSVHSSTITRILGRRGIKCRAASKYSVDEKFFNVLEREEQLYWLSFIYADGCVDRKKLKVKLRGDDSSHLEKLASALRYNGPVKSYRNGKYTSSQIQVYDQQITKKLLTLGIIPGRNHFHLLEKEIPSHLAHHFIRGFLDGDGSIVLSSVGEVYIHFYGQPDILRWIKIRLAEGAGASKRPRIRKSSGISMVTFGGIYQTKDIIRHLYSGATIYLDRKKRLADLVLSLPHSRKERRNIFAR